MSPIPIDPEALERGVLELGHLAEELQTECCGERLRTMAAVDHNGLAVSPD